jgi:hypothetical protein
MLQEYRLPLMFWCALLLFLAVWCGGRGHLVWYDSSPDRTDSGGPKSFRRVLRVRLQDETDRELGVQKAFTSDFLIAEPKIRNVGRTEAQYVL